MAAYNIVLAGSGNLAAFLAPALIKTGHRIVYIFGRNPVRAALLAEACGAGHGYNPDSLPEQADVYILAVSDDAIENVSRSMSRCKGVFVHTSGSTPLGALTPVHPSAGVLYPLMNFAGVHSAGFNDIPLILEYSDDNARNLITGLARSLSHRIIEADSHQRSLIHLAAVFVCNFTNLNYVAAEEILNSGGLDFDLLRPLIAETARKALLEMPSGLQTGPAARADMEVIARHLELLKSRKDYHQMYQLLSQIIIDKRCNEEL